jgi:hypothetical protein
MKVLLTLVVIAVVAGLGVHWAKDKATSAIHHAVDPTLPADVEAHPWAPVSHGRPVRAARVTFDDGAVTTIRCQGALGTYSLRIDHHFSFAASPTHVKAGCPGSQLAAALTGATRADVESHGARERLVFSDSDGHGVATLVGRAR